MPKKILFLDWFGTLSTKLFWPMLKEENPELSQRITDVLFTYPSELIGEWMLGKKSGEEICLHIAQGNQKLADYLMTNLIESCIKMRVEHETIDVIQALRKTHHIILVTDNMDCFSRFTIPQTGIREWTDEILNSSELGRFKNDSDAEIYRNAASRRNIPFHQTVCIDDSEKICSLIRRLGGTAHQTDGEEKTLEILQTILTSVNSKL